MEQAHRNPRPEVAVVGMGCRFPGAEGPGRFWENLMAHRDSVTAVPAERFDIAADYDPTPGVPGRTASRHGGFVADPFSFDYGFFGISPAEARAIDPQQRLLLHATWEAFEDAGIRPSTLAGTHAGVFIGQATAEYSEATRSEAGPNVRDVAGSRLRAVTAGRLSFAFDLFGPSVVLDTACSSSLVAVHQARQSLLAGECDLALAGGVNFVLSSHDAIAYSQGSMLSPGGRCRFGDAGADGFVRSDGVGVIVLKRLADAERDGDRVLATLLGSAVTNDGRGSGLLLQPAISGQVDMLRTACRSAGIAPQDLDYVEAHGTGTSVGDAVELQALAAATERPRRRPLLTGSVKTNIGHAESAAGIAGLIKAVLIARHGVIPASLHCAEPNPVIERNDLGVAVVTRNTPLPRTGDRALLGVSSFGISGTNAHVVVGEYVPDPAGPAAPAAAPPHRGTAEQLLVLSARSARSLNHLAEAYASHLTDGPGRDVPLPELCAAAALRRDAHPYRLWVRGDSHRVVAERLRALAAGESVPEGGTAEAGFGGPRRLAFVFPGQGAQWSGMGRRLLETSPAFREKLLECDAAIGLELGWSVVDLLRQADEFPTDMDKVQPALWAVGVALDAALREAGLTPDVCVGHSMGEVAAAQSAGALGLSDAAAVICRRSRLMRRLAGRGAMLAVELSAEGAGELLASEPEFAAVCVAAENSPSSTVLAGPPSALAGIARHLEGAGVLCRPVKVEVASHSPDMDLIGAELLAALDGLAPRRARTALMSSVTAAPSAGEELGPRYWLDNLRRPVRFAEAVRRLAGTDTVFLEVSPHPVLTAAVEETVTAGGAEAAAVPTLRRGGDEPVLLLEAVGRAFARGAAVDWSRWYGFEPPAVPLPTYCWDASPLRRAAAAAPLVRESRLDAWGLPAAGAGVAVSGVEPVFPSVYLEAAFAAAREAAPGQDFALTGVRLGDAALTLADVPAATLRVTVDAPGPDGSRDVRVEARRSAGAEPEPCARGRLEPASAPFAPARRELLETSLARHREYLSADALYAEAARRGIEAGSGVRTVEHAWRRGGRVVARVRRGGASTAVGWEAGLLAMPACYPAGSGYLPVRFGTVRRHAELTDDYWSLCRVTPVAGGRRARGDVLLLAADGSVLAEFLDIELIAPAGPGAGVRGRLAGALARRCPALPPAARPLSLLRPLAAAPVPLPGPGPLSASVPVPVPTGAAPAPAAVGAEPAPAAARAATDALLQRVSRLLDLPEAAIDRRRSLRDLGLDSLMAAQLRAQVRSDCGLDLTAGRLLGSESLNGLLATIG
ncbi:type I polyketide synthase [Kitasatospora sp. NPDC048194]|uniref:type I polyketide synthase n=1 Tax=Kitasatospora sp. NPDC048194 TaxID=3364045 RepID=UPI00371B1663